MLTIKILCVGKIREKSLKELILEYQKRISKYAKIEIIEVDDEKLPLTSSLQEEEKVKKIESEKLEEKIRKMGKCTLFFLELNGKEYTSEAFSNKIEQIATYENSTIVFVIGGSLGMTEELLSLSSNHICFSKMTFPHPLIRLFLLEQLFRAFKILHHETYHH